MSSFKCRKDTCVTFNDEHLVIPTYVKYYKSKSSSELLAEIRSGIDHSIHLDDMIVIERAV